LAGPVTEDLLWDRLWGLSRPLDAGDARRYRLSHDLAVVHHEDRIERTWMSWSESPLTAMMSCAKARRRYRRRSVLPRRAPCGRCVVTPRPALPRCR